MAPKQYYIYNEIVAKKNGKRIKFSDQNVAWFIKKSHDGFVVSLTKQNKLLVDEVIGLQKNK